MSKTVEDLNAEMIAESLKEAPDDEKLYALQAERDALLEEQG